MNLFSAIFVLMLAASTILQWWLSQRQIRTVRDHQAAVPDAFSSNISLDDHQKAADYTVRKVYFGQKILIFEIIVLLLWTLGGGLEWLDQAWRSLDWSSLWTGVAVLLSVMLINAVINLPENWYRTFRIEAEFGFNRNTLPLFFSDFGKEILLSLALGIPLIALVLWLMAHAGNYWWFSVWVVWFGFSLLMMWAYPAFIAPLFNKFNPLEDDTLRQRIENLLQRNGFTSQGIFVMDGSKRSGHGNAYFTGLGNNKRIVFYDTLLEGLNHDEVEAVLAHEVGHFKHKHIQKRLLWMGLISLGSLALLGWLMQQTWFYHGLGVSTPSNYMALLLFALAMPVFTFFLAPLMAWASRRHEFEADSFAAQQAQAQHLIHALVKLYKENASTLTPDPWYSAFYDSHPPAPVRVAYLSKLEEPA